MLLILTHENSDFDAVASQLAAQKLYPEGVPLLARRVNRNVKQFMALYWDSLPFMRMEEWKRQRVDQVVLVDTQTVPGVRGLAAGFLLVFGLAPTARAQVFPELRADAAPGTGAVEA